MTQGWGCLPVWAPSAPCPSISALYNVSPALHKHRLWLWELSIGVTLQISLLQNMIGALTINIYPGMEFQIPYNRTTRLMFPTLSCGYWDATATISSWHKPMATLPLSHPYFDLREMTLDENCQAVQHSSTGNMRTWGNISNFCQLSHSADHIELPKLCTVLSRLDLYYYYYYYYYY